MSEPALRLHCGGVSRERRRESQVGYETGRDRAALSVSRWSSDEVRPSIIRSIMCSSVNVLCRCARCCTIWCVDVINHSSTFYIQLACMRQTFLQLPMDGHSIHTRPFISLPSPSHPQSLESVPHRDLQLSSSVGVASGLELRPVSTPLSREVRVRLRKSRIPQVHIHSTP